MTETNKEVIKALADNNMNVTATGRATYRDTKSIWRHIYRVREKTGLDPLKFWDLIELLKICGVM